MVSGCEAFSCEHKALYVSLLVSLPVLYNPAFQDRRHALLLVCHAYVTCVGVSYPFKRISSFSTLFVLADDNYVIYMNNGAGARSASTDSIIIQIVHGHTQRLTQL